MINIFLSDREKALIKGSKTSNNEEFLNWKVPNVIFPIFAIVISLIAYTIFVSADKKNWSDFFNLLLNGSIPMIAFNRMSSVISYFSKIEHNDEKKLKINLKNLRVKFLVYIFILIVCILLLYSFQVINRPFEVSILNTIQLLFSGILLWFSVDITKETFFLQDKFLITYEKSFRDTMNSVNQTPQENDINFE